MLTIQNYPDTPAFSFDLKEMLDDPHTENFDVCMPELYPLEDHNDKIWWYPLMVYFIGTNQFKKYRKTAKAIGERDRDVADYALLLRTICLSTKRIC